MYTVYHQTIKADCSVLRTPTISPVFAAPVYRQRFYSKFVPYNPKDYLQPQPIGSSEIFAFRIAYKAEAILLHKIFIYA